jgi:NDP-sugar pyrophosphorylase family protein
MVKEILFYVPIGGEATRLYPLTSGVEMGISKGWLDIANRTPLRAVVEMLYLSLSEYQKKLRGFITTHGLANDVFVPTDLKDGRTISDDISIVYPRYHDQEKPIERRTVTEGSGDAFIHFLRDYRERIEDGLILVLNADNFANFDPTDMARFHQQMHGDEPGVTIGVTYWGLPGISQFGTVRFDESGRILDFREKSPDPASDYINTAIVMFSPTILDILEEGIESEITFDDMGGHIFPYLLEQGVSLYAYGQQQQEFGTIEDWVDFGTIQAYLRANGKAIKGDYDWLDFGDYEEFDTSTAKVLVHKNSLEGVGNANIEFGGNVLIGSDFNYRGEDGNTHISDTIIGHGVIIGPDTEITGLRDGDRLYPSVILNNSTISCCRMEASVIGYSSSIERDGDSVSTLEPFSVVGNAVTLPPVHLRRGVRAAPITLMKQILGTNKYRNVWIDLSNKLFFFEEVPDLEDPIL